MVNREDLVRLRKARDRMDQESRHLPTLYSIQDCAFRFGCGFSSPAPFMELLENLVPVVREGDGSAQILNDVIVAVYALAEVSN